MSFTREKADLEKALLGSFLRKRPDLDAVSEVVPSLTDWKWSDREAEWLYREIEAAWSKHREIPNATLLVMSVPKDKDGEPKTSYLEFLVSAEDSGGAPRQSYEKLQSMRALAALRDGAEKILDGLDEGESQEKLINIASGLTQDAVVSTAKVYDWFDTATKRIELYSADRPVEDRSPRFSLGLPSLNKAVGGYGVPINGRLVMLLASTNVGKSTFATFMMSQALKSFPDMHILDCRTEELEEDIFARYDSLLLNLSRTKITNEGLSSQEIEEALQRLEKAKTFANRLRVASIPMQDPISKVRVEIEKFRSKIGPAAKMVVLVDSPDHLKSGIPKLDPRFDIRTVWFTMKGWTTDKYIGAPTVIATTQGNKESAGSAPSAEDGADSYDKGRTCDLGIGAYEDGDAGAREFKSEGQAYKNLFIGVLNKNRLGGSKRMFRRIRAYMDSCRFEEDTEFDLSRERRADAKGRGRRA